jgi:hypothetical protein
MKKSIRLLGFALGVATAAALLLPGSAQAGDTTVDAVVAAGSLTISSQPASTTLTGATFNQALPSQATGSFGNVTVSDGRGLPVPWALTASSTNYVGLSDNTKSVNLSATSSLQFGAVASPTVGPSGTAGTCTVSGGNLTSAGSGVAIATGTNLLTQLNPVTCTFNPSLTLNVPANTPAQTYRGTVTLTVA